MTAKGSGSVTDVEYVELDYTIRTHWGAGSSEYSEDVVKYYVDLETVTGSWDINKKYIYEITVALDQILWAPQVVEWETDTDSIAVNS